jgi:hypothetical protein
MATARIKDRNTAKPGTRNGANLDNDLDALFKLPLAEFTAARNALAKRLNETGRRADAQKVKGLAKPPVSAWVVNQLHWKYRTEFDRLLQAGERLSPAQASLLAGRTTDMRGLLAERDEAVSALLQLARALLHDAGHTSAPDTLRRVHTTLETLSTFSSFTNGPSPGRLTDDIGPIGFEALAGLAPGTGSEARIEDRQEPPAGVNEALEAAEQTLIEARTRVSEIAAALEKAAARVSEAEEERREAEVRFAKANAAVQETRLRVRELNAEATNAGRAMQDAERAVEATRQRLTRSKGMRSRNKQE